MKVNHNMTENTETQDKRKYHFLFADPPDEVIFDGFKSKSASERIEVVPVYRKMKTRTGAFLEKVILSVIINRCIHMPFHNWFHSINYYDYNDDMDYYMIVPTMSLLRWNLSEIRRLKQKHKNLKMILLILDSMHSGSKHLPFVREKIFSDVWDMIITYDQQDAEEYGFAWLGYAYYPQCEDLPEIGRQSEALYIGFDKGNRNKVVSALFQKLTEAGVDCDFRIVSKRGMEDYSLAHGLFWTNQKYQYKEIAAMAKGTNCIVEVLMEGQQTQSYRYFEAITYNKKLLTNNPNITKLPYYDSRFMKGFVSIDDIDPEWVKKEETIDYGYRGEFAQIRLLDYLEDRLALK